MISEMLERFTKVVHFASNSVTCRHAQLLDYFEELLLDEHPLHPNCCDNCCEITSTKDMKKDADLVCRLINKLAGSPLISLVREVLRATVKKDSPSFSRDETVFKRCETFLRAPRTRNLSSSCPSSDPGFTKRRSYGRN